MKNAITCEDAGMLVSRNLDRDLSRAEVACLYDHLALCSACRARASEMARIESGAAELAKSYERYSLEERFPADFEETLARRKKALWNPSGLAANIRALFASRGFAALAGAAFSLLLFFVFFGTDDEEGKKVARFLLHPISFQASSDTLTWHHDEELAPGDSVQMTIIKGHEDSYHVRIESSGPAEIEMVHEAPGMEKAVHQAVFEGIRYASLQSPRPGDVIVIRNLGRTPVRIKAHTVEKGNATVNKRRQSAV